MVSKFKAYLILYRRRRVVLRKCLKPISLGGEIRKHRLLSIPSLSPIFFPHFFRKLSAKAAASDFSIFLEFSQPAVSRSRIFADLEHVSIVTAVTAMVTGKRSRDANVKLISGNVRRTERSMSPTSGEFIC